MYSCRFLLPCICPLDKSVMQLRASKSYCNCAGSQTGACLWLLPHSCLSTLQSCPSTHPLWPTGVFPGQRRGLRPATGARGRSPAGVGPLCGSWKRPFARACCLPLPSVPCGQNQAESHGGRLSGVAAAGGPVQVYNPPPPLPPTLHTPPLKHLHFLI